jgi:hypothetical protein
MLIILLENTDILLQINLLNIFTSIDNFIDKFSRDIMYRIIHDILPVNILMFKYIISKTYKCVYCNEVETLRHLFFECTFNSQLLYLNLHFSFQIFSHFYLAKQFYNIEI